MAYARKEELPTFASYTDAVTYMNTTPPMTRQKSKETYIPMVKRKHWREFWAMWGRNGDILLCEGNPIYRTSMGNAGYDKRVTLIYHPNNTVTITNNQTWQSCHDYMNTVVPGVFRSWRDNKLWTTIRNADGVIGDYRADIALPFTFDLVDGKARLQKDYEPIAVTRKVIDIKLKNALVKAKYAGFLKYSKAMFNVLKNGDGYMRYTFVTEELRLLGLINSANMPSLGRMHRDLCEMPYDKPEDYYPALLMAVASHSGYEVSWSSLQKHLTRQIVALHPEVLREETVPPGVFVKQVW